MNNANGKNSTLSVAACKPESNDLKLLEQGPIVDFHPYAQPVVVALNFGGPEYKASDGVLYSADSLNIDSAVGPSAQIKGSGYSLYGKVEVSARIPRGQGTWSAIWMLPSNPYKYATSCASDEDWQGSRTCDAWPFDHPYNVILNLAIGRSWGRTGGPIDASIFPLRMEVDYVRIYQSAE
ncbi:glycoside hydrolase family 16 protein [Brumicola pallidula]|uniref:GH16 domain-containing protein n=1 Tax=Brumicola pallidula DSM 14239 = ACAM 615 TaxID=1121922 RepID=K6YDF6_9ALTE|nr:family 16 glycosylhydrolase [Glaciecola pallidula]GAC30769.1 hypothetical protein GPAL_3929 [Glaciecola pallidula DSM 14239 = ACAM 615]